MCSRSKRGRKSDKPTSHSHSDADDEVVVSSAWRCTRSSSRRAFCALKKWDARQQLCVLQQQQQQHAGAGRCAACLNDEHGQLQQWHAGRCVACLNDEHGQLQCSSDSCTPHPVASAWHAEQLNGCKIGIEEKNEIKKKIENKRDRTCALQHTTRTKHNLSSKFSIVYWPNDPKPSRYQQPTKFATQ